MYWIIAGAITLLVVGVTAWYYPHLKSRAAAARSTTRFRALANELGTELAPGDDHDDKGFMSTLASVFGPHGELRHVITQNANNGTVYLLDYIFGARRSGYRRGVAVVAVHLPKTVPMFTLRRPRGPASSRTTEFEARGQRLVVQTFGELELWSMKSDRKRVRRMLDPLARDLQRDPGWNIRAIDDWLVMFNERAQDDLGGVFERAKQLRRLLRV